MSDPIAPSPELSETEPLTRAELIGLFKHWDDIHARKEFLYTPLCFAGLAAVAAGADKKSEYVVLALAVGSILLYFYYLLVVRRISVFQANIFKKLEKKYQIFCP